MNPAKQKNTVSNIASLALDLSSGVGKVWVHVLVMAFVFLSETLKMKNTHQATHVIFTDNTVRNA